MRRFVAVIFVLNLAWNAPTFAASCDTPENAPCCCTNDSASDPCPMVKSAPVPVVALVPAVWSVIPVPTAEAVHQSSAILISAPSFEPIYHAQAPPGHSIDRLASPPRAPPAHLPLPA